MAMHLVKTNLWHSFKTMQELNINLTYNLIWVLRKSNVRLALVQPIISN